MGDVSTYVVVHVNTLKAFVVDPPVTEANGSPGVIAGQEFTVVLQAVDANGTVDGGYNGNVSFGAHRTLDSSELGLPSTIALASGQVSRVARFNRVNGTERGTTFRFTPSGGGFVDLQIYTYFSVTASLEGLVGHTTACGLALNWVV
jgi:hypothetical protein